MAPVSVRLYTSPITAVVGSASKLATEPFTLYTDATLAST
nr:MAG TPA: hypothetical protein [Bacteriophage sp.]